MTTNNPHGAFHIGKRAPLRSALMVATLLLAAGIVATMTFTNISADSSASDLGCVDKNGNGLVDIPELFDVIDAYFDGTADSRLSCVDSNDNGLVDISELFDVIDAYFDSTPIGTPPDTWRGLTIAPEERCSDYDSADYRYSQSLEAQIVESLGGVYGPYTGTWFESTSETDIEHMVARSEAHDSGLCAADADRRREFADDLLNLTLASPSVNRHQKSDNDAAEWLPDLNECWYVDRVVQVRQKYDLTIDQAEADAIDDVLAGCASVEIIILPRPTPESSVGPGTLRVGEDIAPGIYAGRAGTDILDSCYWARLEGASGELDDILANENARGQFYVEVLETDAYFAVNCEVTPLADWPVPNPRLVSLDRGMYLVGRDIDAGTYRGETGEGILESCYWARLSGVTDTLDDILANDNANGQFFVEVETTDYALNTHCGLHLTDEEQEEEVDALAMYDDNGDGRITCAEARRHGIAPVYRGDPAYPYMDDADGDGVVCE